MEKIELKKISKMIFDESIQLNLKAKHGGSLDHSIQNLKALLNSLEGQLNKRKINSTVNQAQSI